MILLLRYLVRSREGVASTLPVRLLTSSRRIRLLTEADAVCGDLNPRRRLMMSALSTKVR